MPERLELTLWRRRLPSVVAWSVILVAAACMVCIYARMYDSTYGWTRLIGFGAAFSEGSLPALKSTPHYVYSNPADRFGYDGQCYAQMALDPGLRNPAFNTALDTPSYRARRIGLPALSYLFGCGRPGWILLAYAIANLFFWLALALILLWLMRPASTQNLLCLIAILFSFGVIESMDSALTDLPAATLIFGALLANFARGTALLAAAVLTRETSALAAIASVEWRRPSWLTLKRDTLRLALVLLPFLIWLIYLKFRFADSAVAGRENFTWPLTAPSKQMILFIHQVQLDPAWQQIWSHLTFRHLAWRHLFSDNYLGYLIYYNFFFHELLVLVALLAQAVYLLARPKLESVIWRIGIIYLLLGSVLGSAVWEASRSSSRVLLPMSIAFYILLGNEQRPIVFWLFFIVTALAIPYGFFELSTYYSD